MEKVSEAIVTKAGIEQASRDKGLLPLCKTVPDAEEPTGEIRLWWFIDRDTIISDATGMCDEAAMSFLLQIVQLRTQRTM